MRLFFRGTFPINQPMTDINQIFNLLLSRHLLFQGITMQQSNKKLTLEEVTFLIDTIDKPSILKDVQ